MRILLLLMAFISMNPAAKEHAKLQPTTLSAPFNTTLAAVQAATQLYNPISVAQDREFIGAIIERDKHYFYTVNNGKPGEDTVSVRLLLPRGTNIVAFWHTHGSAGHGRRYFSAVDTALVKRWNKPFYLADPRGSLRVYRPGDPTIAAIRAEKLGLGRRYGFAKGINVTSAL